LLQSLLPRQRLPSQQWQSQRLKRLSSLKRNAPAFIGWGISI